MNTAKLARTAEKNRLQMKAFVDAMIEELQLPIKRQQENEWKAGRPSQHIPMRTLLSAYVTMAARGAI